MEQQDSNNNNAPLPSPHERSVANNAHLRINQIKLSHVAIVICLAIAAGVSSFSIVVNIRRYFASTTKPNSTQIHHHQVEVNRSWKKMPPNPNN